MCEESNVLKKWCQWNVCQYYYSLMKQSMIMCVWEMKMYEEAYSMTVKTSAKPTPWRHGLRLLAAAYLNAAGWKPIIWRLKMTAAVVAVVKSEASKAKKRALAKKLAAAYQCLEERDRWLKAETSMAKVWRKPALKQYQWKPKKWLIEENITVSEEAWWNDYSM